MENLPPGVAPSNRRGVPRVKAASRWGSVKVWNSSSAVVRNSSDAVTVVVLMDELVGWLVVARAPVGVPVRSC